MDVGKSMYQLLNDRLTPYNQFLLVGMDFIGQYLDSIFQNSDPKDGFWIAFWQSGIQNPKKLIDFDIQFHEYVAKIDVQIQKPVGFWIWNSGTVALMNSCDKGLVDLYHS